MTTDDDAYEAYRDNRDTLRHHGNVTINAPTPVCEICDEGIPEGHAVERNGGTVCRECGSEALS